MLTMTTHDGFLYDHLLVATPAVRDGCFDKTVVYLIAHNESGALGVIINRPLQSVDVQHMLLQLNIPFGSRTPPIKTQFGGPVEPNRGYLLHMAEFADKESVVHPSGIAMSATREPLLKIVEKGVERVPHLLAFGSAMWGQGQLESEIAEGCWIVVPATDTLLFETENDYKWAFSSRALGFDLERLSPDVGHA